jgi:hypothetical protein
MNRCEQFVHKTVPGKAVMVSTCQHCCEFVAASANAAYLTLADAAHHCGARKRCGRQKTGGAQQRDRAKGAA